MAKQQTVPAPVPGSAEATREVAGPSPREEEDVVAEDTAVYHPQGKTKIVRKGHAVPTGWSRDVNVIKNPKHRDSEHLSNIAKQHRHAGGASADEGDDDKD